MGYGAAFGIILASGLAAAAAALVAQKYITVDLRRDHHEVGATVFLQLGVVFAVLLAFVFSEAWTEYNEASAAIDLEVGAMHGAAMIAATLPPPAAKKILGAERDYLAGVVRDEWPAMAGLRNEDPGTGHRLQVLIQAAANLRLESSGQGDKKPEILSLLAQAHAQRELRLYQARSGIPLVLWLVLIGFELVLCAFVALSALRYRISAAMVSGIFAIAISSILVLARLLDFPFEGALGLQPGDFVDVLAKVNQLLRPLG